VILSFTMDSLTIKAWNVYHVCRTTGQASLAFALPLNKSLNHEMKLKVTGYEWLTENFRASESFAQQIDFFNHGWLG